MADESPVQPPAKLGFLNLLIAALSLYVLGALLFDAFVDLDPEVSRLLALIDDLICVVFLYDFGIRFHRAEDKLKFMRWGWVDLISSIPSLEYFRPGRVFRLLRILRVVRALRALHQLSSSVFRTRVEGTFTSVVIIAVLMVIFSSIAMLQVEDDPSSNIKTAEDALWWSYTTITTVGYGDRYPVTTEGRLIAAMLMTVGVGLFGTFTAYVASWFVGDRRDADNPQE